MIKKRMITATMAIMMATASVAPVQVNAAETTQPKQEQAEKVTVKNKLYKNKLYVAKKSKIKVNAKSTGSNTFTFKTNKKQIAKVDKNGLLTGKKVGTTKLTISSKKNPKVKVNVNVQVTNPVKKITLNKSSLDLKEGKSTSLKANVGYDKKACKYVKWTTSDPYVATVDSKGNVKAVGEGVATITATAVDGTKKKAKCKVAVKSKYSKIGLKEVSVIAEHSNYARGLKIVLDHPKTLAIWDVSVEYARKTETGKDKNYNNTSVPGLERIDACTYIVYTDLEDEFEYGDYFLVKVKGLTGTKKKAIRFDNPAEDSNEMILGTVGSACEKEIEFIHMLGDVSTKIVQGKLPEGLRFVEKNNEGYITYCIEGKPSEKTSAEGTTVVVEATDSRGQKSKVTCKVYIGDENEIFTSDVDVTDHNFYEKDDVDFTGWYAGGSGEYILTIHEKKYADLFFVGEKCVSDNKVHFGSKGDNIPAGYHTFTFTITDKKNPNVKASGTVKFIVKEKKK